MKKTIAKEDMLNRIERATGVPKRRPELFRSAKGRPARRPQSPADKFTVDQVMYFDVYGADNQDVRDGKRTPDDALVSMLKQEINAASISRRYLYEFVGEGPGMMFANRNQAYNLEYGLRNRSTISIECATRWLSIIGKELHIEFRLAEG